MAQLLALKKKFRIRHSRHGSHYRRCLMQDCWTFGVGCWALKLGYSSKAWALDCAMLAMDLVMVAGFPAEENPIRLNFCLLSGVPPHQPRSE